MIRLFTTMTLLLFISGIQAQVTSLPLKDATTPLDGMVYHLPKTTLEIAVTVRHTKQTPGPYALYAERYLGISDVIQNEQTSYELVGLTAKPHAVPDAKNGYLVKPLPKTKTTPVISLSPEGFLLGCNIKNAPATNQPRQSIGKRQPKEADSHQTKASSTLTRDMQQATSTAKLAELAAAQLFNLRETRLTLLHQETEHTPADGASFKLLLAELNRMETYYLELFTGSTETTETVQKLVFEPKKEESVVLFRFNNQLGLVDKNDLSGIPVYITLTKAFSPAVDDLKRTVEKKEPVVGIYYRQPAITTVKISDDQRVFWEKTLPVAQLGTVVTLPSHLTSTVEVCPVTGALLKAGL